MGSSKPKKSTKPLQFAKEIPLKKLETPNPKIGFSSLPQLSVTDEQTNIFIVCFPKHEATRFSWQKSLVNIWKMFICILKGLIE